MKGRSLGPTKHLFLKESFQQQLYLSFSQNKLGANRKQEEIIFAHKGQWNIHCIPNLSVQLP